MIHVKVFTFNAAQENTYILYNDERKAIIIDPGCYSIAEQETLKKFLNDEQLTAIQLVNTHCHLDHVFGNNWINKTMGLELFIHPNEKQVLEFAPLSGERWGMPFTNYEGPLHFFEHGDEIQLGNDKLNLILAPGHSPGSICFYCAEQSFIIGGDVLFFQSIGRTDLPLGDSETLIKSIKEQLFTLPDTTIVYPGHGKPTTIGHEKAHNPFLK